MMTPRHLLLVPLCAGAVLLGGCTGRSSSPEADFVAHLGGVQAGQRVLFDMQDPRGDDRGGGRYDYPTSFQGRFGFLDLTRFRVLDSGRFVTFLIEFRRPISRRRDDGSTEAKGYWLQLVDIYVDRDGLEGSGRTWALPGRNVRFEDRSGWEKVVLVTPGRSSPIRRLIQNRTSDLRLVEARNDILVPDRVFPQGYELKVVVPKDDLGGTPGPDWSYQVLAMSYDPDNLAHHQLQNGKVNRFADDYHFGGGTDQDGDPNVIDLLAPSEQAQYRWLSNYHSSPYRERIRWAVVPMIRAVPSSPPGARVGPVRPEPPATVPAPPSVDAASPAPTSPSGSRGAVGRDPDAPAPGGLSPPDEAGTLGDEPSAGRREAPEFSFEFSPAPGSEGAR